MPFNERTQLLNAGHYKDSERPHVSLLIISHVGLFITTLVIFGGLSLINYYYPTINSSTLLIDWFPLACVIIWFSGLGITALFSACKHLDLHQSSLAISIMSCIKVVLFLLRGIQPDGEYTEAIFMILGGLEYVTNIYVAYRIPAEYIARERKRVVPLRQPCHPRQPSSLATRLKYAIWSAIILSNTLIVVLGFISINARTDWTPLLVKWSEAISVLSGFIIVKMSITDVQTEARRGLVMYSKEHSNGLVLVLINFGMMCRFIIDVVVLVKGSSAAQNLPLVSLEPFLDGSKELITVGIPLGMHIYNINAKSANVVQRTLVACFLVALTFNLMLAGYVVETSSFLIPTVTFARVNGLLAAVYLNLAILSILAPLSQLLYAYLNMGVFTQAIHKMHFHRNMAMHAVGYFTLHSLSHVGTWIFNPEYSVGGFPLYYISNPAILTGIAMLVLFVVAFVSGFYRSWFSVHIISVVLAVLCFMIHGYQRILGPPIGDYMTMIVTASAYLIMEVFRAINPVHLLNVVAKHEHKIMDDKFYLLLVLENSNMTSLPGPYFNIYNTDSRLKLFHAHPFSAFSKHPRELCFLISTTGAGRFTDELRTDLANLQRIYVHGPFVSPANSLVDYITSHRNDNLVVFLCCSGTGIAPVSSLATFLESKMDYFERLTVYIVCKFDTHGMEKASKAGSPPFLPQLCAFTGFKLHEQTGDARDGRRRIAKPFQTKHARINYLHIVEEEPESVAVAVAVDEPSYEASVTSVGVAFKISGDIRQDNSHHALFFCGQLEESDLIALPQFNAIFTETFE